MIQFHTLRDRIIIHKNISKNFKYQKLGRRFLLESSLKKKEVGIFLKIRTINTTPQNLYFKIHKFFFLYILMFLIWEKKVPTFSSTQKKNTRIFENIIPPALFCGIISLCIGRWHALQAVGFKLPTIRRSIHYIDIVRVDNNLKSSLKRNRVLFWNIS